MSKKETLLEEILVIRKRMGLNNNSSVSTFLNEIFETEKKILLEQGETKLATKAGKAIASLFTEVADDTYKIGDQGLDRTLQDLDLRFPSGEFEGRSIRNLTELEDFANYYMSEHQVGRATTQEDALKEIFSIKGNSTLDNLKNGLANGINKFSMQTVKADVAGARTQINGKSANGKIVSNPTEGSGGVRFEVSMSPVDDALDEFEKKFLKRKELSTGRKPVGEIVDVDDFEVNGDELIFAGRTSEEILSDVNLIATKKTEINGKLSLLGKQIDEADNIIDSQKDFLKKEISMMRESINVILDRTEKLYNSAGKTKQVAEKESEYAIKTTRTKNIYDKDDPNISQKEKDLMDEARANQASELVGGGNGFVRWYRNLTLGGNKAGYGSSTYSRLTNLFEGVNEIIVSYNKRILTLINRNAADLTGSKLENFTTVTKRMLTELYAESPGRYSYADIKARMQILTNDMLTVVRETMQSTGKEGTEVLTNKLRSRLIELMKEMESLQMIRKSFGDQEKIASLQKQKQELLSKGNLDAADTQKLNRITRELDGEILDKTAAQQSTKMIGDVRVIDLVFKQFVDLGNDIKIKIDKAASEGVEGAPELKAWWEEAGKNGKSNYDNLIEMLKGADKEMKEKTNPNIFKNFGDTIKEMVYIGKILDEYRTKPSTPAIKTTAEETAEKGTDDFIQSMVNDSNMSAIPKENIKTLGSFFKGIGNNFITNLLIKGGWNVFKYGFMTSIKEIDRLMIKYGPIKMVFILSVRQAVLSAFLTFVGGFIIEGFLLIDNLLKQLFGKDDGGKYLITPYILGISGAATENADVEKESAEIQTTISKMKEYLRKDFSDRMMQWINPPTIKRMFIDAGLMDIVGNIYKGFVGKDMGANPYPLFLGSDKDWGLFNGYIDETIIWLTTNTIKYFYGDKRSNDSDELMSEIEIKINETKNKIKNIGDKGLEFGKEKIEEINKSEQKMVSTIDEYTKKGYYGDLSSKKDYYDKLTAIIQHEFEPNFESQLSGLPPKEREKKGVELFSKWYASRANSVGVTDLDGTFYRVAAGNDLLTPFEWIDLTERGKTVTGPNGITIKGVYVTNKNLNGELSYNQSNIYIYNPKDQILYVWSSADKALSQQQVDKIYQTRKVDVDAQVDLNNLSVKEKNIRKRLEELEDSVYDWEDALISIEGKTQIDIGLFDKFPYIFDSNLTYPETVSMIKAKLNGGEYSTKFIDATGKEVIRTRKIEKGLYQLLKEKEEEYDKVIEEFEKIKKTLGENTIKKIIMSEMKKYNRQRLFEEEEEQRFGENKFDHWYDTFTFQKYDEKTNDFKDIDTDTLKHGLIKDRFSDFIKNYDGDDAFVRAVVDTHPDVVRIKYLKDQANIQETYYPTGLASVLSLIRESKGEYDIFSVSRLKGGNWHLVKGDFTQKEMSNMVLTKQVPPEKQPKQRENGLESLKKKESTGTTKLASDETEGLKDLPKRVKEKLKEKISKGWTTETPPKVFHEFYEESELNSVFNDKIKIYKLDSTPEFFKSLKDNSSHVLIRKGFCRSITLAKKDSDISNEQRKVVNHILNKCDEKFEGKLGLSYLSKRS
jgi:hypothetical protein